MDKITGKAKSILNVLSSKAFNSFNESNNYSEMLKALDKFEQGISDLKAQLDRLDKKSQKVVLEDISKEHTNFLGIIYAYKKAIEKK